MRPKVLEQCIWNQFPLIILLEDDDDHTNELLMMIMVMVMVMVMIDDDDDDDDDPVELFQKRGKLVGVDRTITISNILSS